MERLTIGKGTWVRTKHFGIAVCIDFDSVFAVIRYQGIRMIDNKEIWVLNGEHVSNIEFWSEPDEISRYVCSLNGPYGLD